MTARSSPEGAWAAGPRFGPYRVVREVARGGMGVVYEAVHEATGVRYALKTLPPELLHAASADDVERLRREAEGMARVRHPHVARVHAAEFAGSFPYLVQAYLPGGSLAERLEREGPLPPDQAVETVRALGDGLARCHRVGVLHRDLKPQNVLYDENDRPCLTDFGLARLRGAERLTTSGTLMGTPSYMAPEQARGEGVDERADVYGLGALLYACLAGRPPFSGPSVIGLLQAVLTTPPPPPSRFVPEVPPWLDAVVLRALAKDPQERFASVREFVSALERGAPLRPRPRRALAGALAGGLVVAGLALVGLAFAWSAGAPARPQEGSPPRGAGAAGETPAGSAQATEPAPFRSSRHGLPLALELLAWRRAHPAGRVDPTVETRLALASHPLWSLDLRATAFSRARLIDDAAGPLLLYNDEPRSRVFAVALRSFSGKDPLRSLSTGGMLAWALEYDPARRWVVLAGSCPDPADPRHGAGWAGCFALESNRAVVKRTLLKAELRAIATLAPGRYVLGGTSLLALWEPP
ncbi:MAG: serine/threonine protein kinase, partial [Planctomycetota bacterium]